MIGNTLNEFGHSNLAFPLANALSIKHACDILSQMQFFRNWKQARHACRINYSLLAGLHQRNYTKSNFTFWTRLLTSMFEVSTMRLY